MTPHDLERHLELARDAIAPTWDAARAERVHALIPVRARARLRRRRAGLVTAAVVVAGLITALWPRQSTSIEATDAHSLIAEVRGGAVPRYEVKQGKARLAVARRSQPVQVQAGPVELEVLSTRALVEVADGRALIVVEEGEVHARWPGGETVLKAGSKTWLPPAPPIEAAPVPVEVAPVDAAPVEPPVEVAPVEVAPVAPPSSAPRVDRKRTRTLEATWRKLASIGDYQAAWLELAKAGPVRDEAAELLMAADVARLSGHPDAAVQPLERVIAAHRRDARAALAAFTLGRVLLDDLGRPRDAMAAFATASQLAPRATLAEDALARQVEAASKAQDPSAHTLAEAFLAKYPESSRARAVRHFGGLR